MENASRGKLCTSSQKKARVPVWDCMRRLALYRVSLGFRSGIFSEKCLKRGKVDKMIENYVPWKKDCILQRTDGPKITFNVFSCSFLGFRTDTWLKRKSGTCQVDRKEKNSTHQGPSRDVQGLAAAPWGGNSLHVGHLRWQRPGHSWQLLGFRDGRYQVYSWEGVDVLLTLALVVVTHWARSTLQQPSPLSDPCATYRGAY